MNIYIVWICHS